MPRRSVCHLFCNEPDQGAIVLPYHHQVRQDVDVSCLVRSFLSSSDTIWIHPSTEKPTLYTINWSWLDLLTDGTKLNWTERQKTGRRWWRSHLQWSLHVGSSSCTYSNLYNHAILLLTWTLLCSWPWNQKYSVKCDYSFRMTFMVEVPSAKVMSQSPDLTSASALLYFLNRSPLPKVVELIEALSNSFG